MSFISLSVFVRHEDDFKYQHFSIQNTHSYLVLTGDVSQSPTLAKLKRASLF